MGPTDAAPTTITATLATHALLGWGLAVALLLGGAGAAWWVWRRRARGTRRDAAHGTAGRDPVTGLALREAFEHALDDAVAACDRGSAALGVLCVGLDGFRQVNDAYGHRIGDAVLRLAAQRLAPFAGAASSTGSPRSVGSGSQGGGPAHPGHLARLGGSEFVLIVGEDDRIRLGDAAAAVLQALQQPYEIDDLALRVGASIGVAAYPEHGSRPRLMGNAALAMRSVKLAGGGGHAFYDPALAVDHREQADLLQDLRHALERGQLELYFQPKVDARTLQITAAEALLRWQHPRRGMIAPAVFIPLAERHGLIGPIGRWVVEEACRQAGAWRQQGLRMRVAVNISGHQMRQDDLVQHIERQLHRHGIPPGRLTCEITESVAMEDTAHTRAAFERLRRAGLHVSIDDFGTGHSSLAWLRRLPAAEIKIDRAFVADLGSGGEHACSIVRTIVQLARTLGLRTVAEGVETEAQRDALVELGCDELQGFLFARPMPAKHLALWAEGDDDPHRTHAGFSASLFAPTSPAPLER
jgi:predicted signal transduction protein with EAL and GGDEF domain